MTKKKNAIWISAIVVIYLFYSFIYKNGWIGINSAALVERHKTTIKQSKVTRPKATFVILARNSDIEGLNGSISQLEARFNHKYGYPYVFLNDEPFSEEFVNATRKMTNATTYYGEIPVEHWSIPSWINQTRAEETRRDMGNRKIIYGDSKSYRHMCRFNSGYFYKHPLLDQFDYYWRVEPGVRYSCDIEFDPFLRMQQNGFMYSFTVSLYEYIETIPTLWATVQEYIKGPGSEHLTENNSMAWILKEHTNDYNLCHFWSNFEIANLSFFRSKAYNDFFEYLDKAGGFFYERWGDAPVHSIAAAMLLRPEEIHFFNEIGYYHAPFEHCPAELEFRSKCTCNPSESFDYNGYSCTANWFKLFGKT